MSEPEKAAGIVEDCKTNSSTYQRETFIARINDMTEEEFSNFCREISVLSHHYHSSIGTPACDYKDFVEAYPEKFFRHAIIDMEGKTGFVSQE